MQRQNLIKGVKAVLGSQGLGQSLAQLNVNRNQELEIHGASVEEQNTIHVIRPSMVEYHRKQLAERKKVINREMKKMREKRKMTPTRKIKFTPTQQTAPTQVQEEEQSFTPEDSAVFCNTAKFHKAPRNTTTNSSLDDASSADWKKGEPVPENLLCDFLKRRKVLLQGEFTSSTDFIQDCLNISGALKSARFRPEPGMVMIAGAETPSEQKSVLFDSDTGVQVICESDLVNIAVATHEAEMATKRAWEQSVVLNPPKPKIIHSDAAPDANASTTATSPSVPPMDEIEKALTTLNQQQNLKSQAAASLVNDISAVKALKKRDLVASIDGDLWAAFGLGGNGSRK